MKDIAMKQKIQIIEQNNVLRTPEPQCSDNSDLTNSNGYRCFGKTTAALFCLTLLLFLLLAVSQAGAQPAEVNTNFFYSSLSPYGDWIELNPGFVVWKPFNRDVGWRPYFDGRWAWTRYGWYWYSYEPFGWITYHYGRWYYDDYYEWIWIPDDTWGPSWVEWRYSDAYIGWAPLPPYASFSLTVGIRFTTRWDSPYYYWTFLQYRHFLHDRGYRYAVSPEFCRRLMGVTRTENRYDYHRDGVINRGIDRDIIEQRGFGRVPYTEIVDRRERGESFRRGSGSIEMYRPTDNDWQDSPQQPTFKRGEKRASLEFERIERRGLDGTQNMRRVDESPAPAPDVVRQSPDNRIRENQRRVIENTPVVVPDRKSEEKRVVQPPEKRTEQDRSSKPRVQEKGQRKEPAKEPKYERPREREQKRIEQERPSRPAGPRKESPAPRGRTPERSGEKKR
jgi:hypothetical protein